MHSHDSYRSSCSHSLLLQELRLTHFRSWDNLHIVFSQPITLFVGENGVGKTNIVESLYFLATLHSHRTSELSALVRTGHKQAIITIVVCIRGKRYEICAQISAQGTVNALINGENVKPLRSITHYLPTVLFAPEDLKLIKGEPQNRRKYIDNLFIYPRLEGLLREYIKIVKHKTALLKNPRLKRDADLLTSLDIWDEKLIACGKEIIAARKAIIEKINPQLHIIYHHLAPHSAKAFFDYEKYSHCDNSDDIGLLLAHDQQAYREAELQRGQCLFGPHRDDISIYIGKNNARHSASHGESWSLALALRICEYQYMCQEGKFPLVILDDVFAELDIKRREKLTEYTKNFSQTIITAAVAQDVPLHPDSALMNITAQLHEDIVCSQVLSDIPVSDISSLSPAYPIVNLPKALNNDGI